MAQERFEELIGLVLDDDATVAQLDELFGIVSADALKLEDLRAHLLVSDRLEQYEHELREDGRFLSALQTRIHAANSSNDFMKQVAASIEGEANDGPLVLSSTDSQSRRLLQFRGMAGWVVAASLLLLFGVLYLAVYNGTGTTLEEVVVSAGMDDSGVAVLTRVAGLKEPSSWRVGQTIPRGSMKWGKGILQLEFYCGATVVVEGPAEIEVLDESRLVCRLGRLRAHVPEPARGFAVLAPSFELVDLGTKFGVSVVEGGSTEVHVFAGKVELYDRESNRNPSTRRELTTGDALTVDRTGVSRTMAVRDADFVTPMRLSEMTDARKQGQLREWTAFRDSLESDPRVVAYFPFDRNAAEDRLLVGYGADSTKIEGAIVGCEWSEGRWPDKSSLQFKRPGDRVRINVPGEFDSLTYSTWLRVDGLDRVRNSLMLTDGFGKNGIHWQIRQDGSLTLGMRYANDRAHNYHTRPIFDLFRLGQWVHLATVYDTAKGQVTHYVNGEPAERQRLKRFAAGMLKIGNATIGNWSGRKARDVRNLNGCIDELIVFAAALDDQEVRKIYEVGQP